jgi:formylglycine-generating enzyme required for sulfatase activity
MKKVMTLALTLSVAVPLLAEQAAPAGSDAILRRFADEFIRLTPGEGRYPASFQMGSSGDAPATERPAHPVTLRRPFAMARYEVTQELYAAVMGPNPSRWKGPRNSVELVSWPETITFCEKATAALREAKLLKADEVIRLPSEAEWEYACRAGTTTRYSFGDGVELLGDYAWFKGNSKGEDPPVGRKKPNAWGLYDMHGYVWEWCQDAWHPTYEGAPADGTAREAKDAPQRVIRGGSWADAAEQSRSAYRRPAAIETRSDAIGFRCVRASR